MGQVDLRIVIQKLTEVNLESKGTLIPKLLLKTHSKDDRDASVHTDRIIIVRIKQSVGPQERK